MKYLEFLNDSQRQAATFVDGALLILAGAGSGKTQTMISRLVYLISEVGIAPDSILTLTFTNKAAASMKDRAIKLLNEIGHSGAMPVLGTFHSFGMEFLSDYVDLLNGKRRQNYRIADTDDRKDIIKEIVLNYFKQNNPMFHNKDKLSKEEYQEHKDMLNEYSKELSKYIERSKNTLEFNEQSEYYLLYCLYEKELEIRNLVDFDDLIILPYEILKNNPKTASAISLKYSYIMVDEYQDTNLAQLKLLKLLCKEHSNIVVVGDDDQSIYSFRHARVENILGFSNDFANSQLIKLEENYRSTKTILECANKVIANNKSRYGKKLYTNNEFDDEIEKFHTYSQVCDEILRLKERDVRWKDICIIYRMNRSSNFIEPKLLNFNIPYKVIGSVPFYSRAEIKLLLHYLNFYLNKNDNFSFRKIINAPKRKFGEKALIKLESMANNQSLYESLKSNLATFKGVEIKEFVNLFESTEDKFAVFLDKLYQLEVYKLFENSQARKENCDLFFDIIKRECGFNADLSKLSNLLNKIILQENLLKENPDAINLMSIHASKGLEYDFVFLIDCNYGDMPCTHIANCDVEEERRLLYVAITRAKKKFYVEFSEESPSMFINEMFANPFDNKPSFTQNQLKNNECEFAKNDLVVHKLFGIGKVTSVENHQIVVNFQGSIRNMNKDFLTKI